MVNFIYLILSKQNKKLTDYPVQNFNLSTIQYYQQDGGEEEKIIELLTESMKSCESEKKDKIEYLFKILECAAHNKEVSNLILRHSGIICLTNINNVFIHKCI